MKKMLDKAVQLVEQKQHNNATMATYMGAGLALVSGGIIGGVAYIFEVQAFAAILSTFGGALVGSLPAFEYYRSGKEYLDNKREMISSHREWTDNWTPDAPPFVREQKDPAKLNASQAQGILAVMSIPQKIMMGMR